MLSNEAIKETTIFNNSSVFATKIKQNTIYKEQQFIALLEKTKKPPEKIKRRIVINNQKNYQLIKLRKEKT